MSQQNREEESRIPRQGVAVVLAIVVGIFAALALVGTAWRFLN